METSSVAPDNSKVSTVKLGRETSLVAYSTDHRQPKLNIREPLNYKDLYANTTDLSEMVETNIVLSIKST